MYDVSGKNHLVVNQYRLVYYDNDSVVTITLYNVRKIMKKDGIVYVYFYQDKTEPLLLEELYIICICKVNVDRSVIL